MKTKKLILKKNLKHLQEAIYMKCLDCCCAEPKEILLCEIKGCPLWIYRPKETKGLYILVKKLKQNNKGLYEAKE